jgi:hypothetical protein
MNERLEEFVSLFPVHPDYIEIFEKEPGQVINRSELIREIQGVEFMDPGNFRLEPEWVLVLLFTLVYSGDLVLAIPGKKFDATELSLLSSYNFKELLQFKHIERPKDWNIPALKALYQLFDLPPGYVTEVTQGNNVPVQQLQKKVAERVEKLVLLKQKLQKGISFWGRLVLSTAEEKGLVAQLDRARSFLESLQPYSSTGKLKNLEYNLNEIDEQSQALGIQNEIEALLDLITDIGDPASYLATAEALLPAGHDLLDDMKTVRGEISNQLADKTQRNNPAILRQALQRLNSLKKNYMKVYLELHRRARLGANEHKQKTQLGQDHRQVILNDLAGIELMPRQHLEAFKNKLEGLRSCYTLTEKELEESPLCPHCSFKPGLENPKMAAAVALDHLENDLDKMLEDWKLALLSNLEEPGTKNNIELLKPADRQRVIEFINSSELPVPCGGDFIRVLREVLSGLVKVTIKTEDLRNALLKGGTPVTAAELKNRFEKFLEGLTVHKEIDKVRIVLE